MQWFYLQTKIFEAEDYTYHKNIYDNVLYCLERTF